MKTVKETNKKWLDLTKCKEVKSGHDRIDSLKSPIKNVKLVMNGALWYYAKKYATEENIAEEEVDCCGGGPADNHYFIYGDIVEIANTRDMQCIIFKFADTEEYTTLYLNGAQGCWKFFQESDIKGYLFKSLDKAKTVFIESLKRVK